MNLLHLLWIIPVTFSFGFFISSALGYSKISELYAEIDRLRKGDKTNG